jgi:hypothetical protein
MSTPLDDRPSGEATAAWKDAQSGKAKDAEQALTERAAAKPPAPPALKLELPPPALGIETRARQDLTAATQHARLLDQRQEKFADNRQPDLVTSKEKDYEAERGELSATFNKTQDDGREK